MFHSAESKRNNVFPITLHEALIGYGGNLDQDGRFACLWHTSHNLHLRNCKTWFQKGGVTINAAPNILFRDAGASIVLIS